jgi:hypothetical protein
MSRHVVIALFALALITSDGAAARAIPGDDDRTYQRDNAHLARATPHYPRARLLVGESVWGEAGTTPFEAIQRIYVLAKPSTQQRIMSFYRKRLGKSWRQTGQACLVSRQRVVVALLYPKRRRLGVVVDSRGASYCRDHVANTGILLEVGYPD